MRTPGADAAHGSTRPTRDPPIYDHHAAATRKHDPPVMPHHHPRHHPAEDCAGHDVGGKVRVVVNARDGHAGGDGVDDDRHDAVVIVRGDCRGGGEGGGGGTGGEAVAA